VKLVVDTGVLLSGALWTGNPSRLVDALLDGTATLCISATLLAEFEDVVQREKFRARLEKSGRSANEIISLFRSAAIMVEPGRIHIPAELRDPDDVHVLGCAATSAADAIVTGDKDLLALKSFAGISILTVSQAIQKLGIAVA
jgi:putative PIN family toxin of toxin-antitoxin system